MIETTFNSTQENLVPQLKKNARCFQKPTQSQATVLAVLPKHIIGLKKPMRPLAAYHIFFQIEREYIIQNLDGEDADKSIHKGKLYTTDVPARYLNIKLSPDWYAGPGKRQKRKHRKSHGKIGFLELSRQVSTRWAKLEELDSETKHFVKTIAQSELEEYHREMEEYKASTKTDTVASKIASLPVRKEPFVNSEKLSSPQKYQQTLPQHAHPYKTQQQIHFQPPMHLQSPKKPYRPATAPTSSYSVFKNNTLDFDNSTGCDVFGINGDMLEYFLSYLDEEENKYCQHHDLLGDDIDSSNKENELDIAIYNCFCSDTTKRSNECNVDGTLSQGSLCELVSKMPALDHEHKQPEAKLDTLDGVDIGDDEILKL